jgi:hypothetical protein
VPLAAGVVGLCLWGAILLGRAAGFQDLRMKTDATGSVGTYELMQRKSGESKVILGGITRCDDQRARQAILKDAEIHLDGSSYCEGKLCDVPALFALARGEKLRLTWTSSTEAALRLGMASRNYSGGFFYSEGGSEMGAVPLAQHKAGEVALEAQAGLSGYYVLRLAGPKGAAVEPCVVPAGL